MAVSHQRGYNHNIAHRGRVYHVQSEDSGNLKSHIYTHVFVNGTIIATNKVDYNANEGSDGASQDLAARVVALMQASHKKMIKQLRNGELDQKIEVLLGGHPEAANKSPSNPAKEPEPAPVLAQNKISRTPPARRNLGQPQTSPHLNPALRTPLSANEHAQHWLAGHRSEASRPVAEADKPAETKERLAQLRQVLAQNSVDPGKVPVDEELAQLFREV